MQREAVAQTFLAPALIGMMLNIRPSPTRGFRAEGDRLRCLADLEVMLVRARDVFGCDFGAISTASSIPPARAAPSPRRRMARRTSSPCAGRPWPGWRWRSSIPRGCRYRTEIGEIAIRGDIAYQGLSEPCRGHCRGTGRRLARTGHAGFRDPDGDHHVHDRIKDMIVSGGRTSIRPRSRTRSRAALASPTSRSSACPTRAGARR
ncbi:hypothetical protein AB5I41_24575 [Sphingomonas sp. MMS24-JH45]